jgi:hypothetical protein
MLFGKSQCHGNDFDIWNKNPKLMAGNLEKFSKSRLCEDSGAVWEIPEKETV